MEEPPTITGPVLIRTGDLNRFEFGSKVLNPEESFRTAKPIAFLQNGTFVYKASYPVPLAAAIGGIEPGAWEIWAAKLKAKQ